MFGGGEVEILVFLLVYLIPLGLLLWALIDALKRPRLRDTDRLIWVIVIIFIPCIGPILYFVIGRAGRPHDPREFMPDLAPDPPDEPDVNGDDRSADGNTGLD